MKLLETNFQKKLKIDLQDRGWKVIKLQSGMGFTVLDFFATSVDYGPLWIELKTVPSIDCKIGLTELQRKEMADLQKAGCLSMVAVGYKFNNIEHLYLSTNPKEEKINEHQRNANLIRFKGQWDVGRIGDFINSERERLNLWG